MTYDEILVRELKAITEVGTYCSDRVYHLQVFQKLPSSSRYPCIVYSATDDDPEEELAENPGLYTATYSLILITENSSQLRPLAKAIKVWFNDIDNIDRIQCETEGEINWLSCKNDAEDNIFAFEQQEKGKQTTVLQVAIDHWQ